MIGEYKAAKIAWWGWCASVLAGDRIWRVDREPGCDVHDLGFPVRHCRCWTCWWRVTVQTFKAWRRAR